MIRELLKSYGYPEDTVVLDCESFFDKDYSLKKLSTYEYVTDIRFEELGWAVKENSEPAVFQQIVPQLPWKNITVIMHNAPFDALVLAMHHGVYPPYIIDTLDLARHVEPRWSNKLADLCKRHGLPDKHDNQFIELHRTNFDKDIRMAALLAEYATNDAEREYDLLQLLLPKLSNPVFELQLMEYTRNLFIKPVLSFNIDRARKLKSDMQAEVRKVIKQTGLTETQLRSNKFFESQLRETMLDDPPMKQGKRGPILAIAKTDPGYTELLNHPIDRIRQLMEARVAVKSWPLHIKRIERLRQAFGCAKQRLPIPLKYCGAHTGRWSGTEGMNPQNFTARGHPLANQIRTLIEAPKGHTLLILDQAQIEARILDWLAEQNDMLRAFAEGRQIYCEFASELIGHRVRKSKKTDSKVVADWHNNYRQMGKIGILGCGYGMGADHCMEYAKNNYGIHLTHVEAKRIIKLYRRTHSMVVLFWEKVERAFRMATQTGQAYELSFGLRFFREDNTTVIQLPSTRRLYYTGAKVEGTTRYPKLTMPNPAKHGPRTLHMWGGYLVENIVQATSRDTLAETILKIEKLGVRIPLTVHDDISIIIPENEVEVYQPQIEDIARTPPTWASQLPVGIECKVSKEYCK